MGARGAACDDGAAGAVPAARAAVCGDCAAGATFDGAAFATTGASGAIVVAGVAAATGSTGSRLSAVACDEPCRSVPNQLVCKPEGACATNATPMAVAATVAAIASV